MNDVYFGGEDKKITKMTEFTKWTKTTKMKKGQKWILALELVLAQEGGDHFPKRQRDRNHITADPQQTWQAGQGRGHRRGHTIRAGLQWVSVCGFTQTS